MPGAWRVYLVSALVACVVAAATAFITVRLLIPAPNTLATSPEVQSVANTKIYEGVVEVRIGGEPEVFYPTPFASPPNLTFPDGLAEMQCQVTEQKAGSFKLQRAGIVPFGAPALAKVKGKAEGPPTK